MTRFVQWMAVVASFGVISLTLLTHYVSQMAESWAESGIALILFDRIELGVGFFWLRFGWLAFVFLYLPVAVLALFLTRLKRHSSDAQDSASAIPECGEHP